jgi:hypothetical protein
VDVMNPTGNTTYLINKSTRIEVKSKRKPAIDFIDAELFSDNQSRLIRRDLSNSSMVMSELTPSPKLITSSNVTNRQQIVEFNSSFQFSTALIFDQDQSHSWHLKVQPWIDLALIFLSHFPSVDQ